MHSVFVVWNETFYAPQRDFGRYIKTVLSVHLSVCLSVCASVHNKSYLCHNLKTSEANLMKLHRKIKYNEKACHIQDLGCHTQDQDHCQGLKVKTGFCNYIKTTQVNIIKCHRKIKHNEKICHI